MEQAVGSRPADGVTAAESGSKTIADLLPRAVERFGGAKAVMYKDEAGQWQTRSFAEVGDIVRRLSLGLISLGIEKGDKVSILANTRPEWTYCDFAALSAGAAVARKAAATRARIGRKACSPDLVR